MRYVQSVIDSNEEAVHSNQYQAYKSLSEAFRGVTYETFYPHKVVIGDPAQCAAADRGDSCIGDYQHQSAGRFRWHWPGEDPGFDGSLCARSHAASLRNRAQWEEGPAWLIFPTPAPSRRSLNPRDGIPV